MVSDLDNGHEQVDFRLKWILSSVKFNKQAHAFYSFRWIEVHPYKTQIRKGLYAKSRTTCGLFEIALWPTENVFMTRLRWYHTDFPQSAMQTTAKHFSGGLAHPSMLLNCHLQFHRHLARRDRDTASQSNPGDAAFTGLGHESDVASDQKRKGRWWRWQMNIGAKRRGYWNLFKSKQELCCGSLVREVWFIAQPSDNTRLCL